MSAHKKNVYFPNLDALRFIAFLLVFLQHSLYNAFRHFEHNNYLLDRIIAFFFLAGGTGVQIFFVLSGFLITYLIIAEINTTGKLNVGKFYMRRTLRIWPLYYATVIFSFIIYPFLKANLGINSELCSTPWYYFSFLANFDSIHIAINCPGKDAMIQNIVWSVSIEEQFYLIWPLLFIVFRKHQSIVLFLVLIACCIFRLYNSHANSAILYFHTLSVMGDLAIGGLAAYFMIYSDTVKNCIQLQSRKMIIITYLVIFSIYFFGDKFVQYIPIGIFFRWLLDIFWALIILEQNFSEYSFFKLFRLRFFSNFGKYTYGLYMLHPIGILIIDILFRIMKMKTLSFGTTLFMGICSFIVSLIIAKLSYKYFEMPFLRLKERFAVIRTKTA